MTITYPISMPDLQGMSSFSFQMKSVNAVVRSSFTLKSQVQTHQGQMWMASMGFPPRNLADSADWRAFLTSLNGMQGTFFIGDPLATSPRGSVLGTPLVNGASQTGQVLLTKGWTADETGVLLAGDYIQIGSGSTTRLYKVLVDADSDGSGLSSLDIWPRLRESPSNSAAITTSSTKGTFRLSKNIQGWSQTPAGFYVISFAAEEAF